MKEINTRKIRVMSNIGILILVCGLLLTWFKINDFLIATIGMSITLSGWYIFSKYHTQIAIYDLHKITSEYLEDIKKEI